MQQLLEMGSQVPIFTAAYASPVSLLLLMGWSQRMGRWQLVPTASCSQQTIMPQMLANQPALLSHNLLQYQQTSMLLALTHALVWHMALPSPPHGMGPC